MNDHAAKIVAIEMCPARFGFVVFDGPVALIDWGVRNFSSREVLREKISALVTLHAPTRILIRCRHSASEEARARTRVAAVVVREEMRRQQVDMENVGTKEVSYFFLSRHQCQTKHQIATKIADWFVELSSKLPAERKKWQSEPYAIAVFDAAATAITYFAREYRGVSEETRS